MIGYTIIFYLLNMSSIKPFWIGGKHAVLSALNNPSRFIKKVVLLNKENLKLISSKINSVVEKEIFFKKIFSNTDLTHQGFAAEIYPLRNLVLKDFLNEKRKEKLTFVILNNIQDNRNIGSIIRTSLAFDVSGLIIEKKNFRSQNVQMYKSACGAIEKIPIFEVTNLVTTFKSLKDENIWIYSLDSNSTNNINDINFSNRTAFVFGSEDKGINNLIKRKSDQIIRIPMNALANSLNVSNAVASALTFYKFNK